MKTEAGLKTQTDKKKPSRKKYIIAAVILLVLITLVFGIFNWESEPDPASEKLIRYYAAKALTDDPDNPKDPNALTDEDFSKVIKLSISSPYTSQLGNRTKITTWYVKNINLADIRMLRKFTNLQEFELIFTNYPKEKAPQWMEVLESYGLMNLENRLYIDLKPLEDLIHLKKLNFIGSDIKNIEPLKNLKNLESLNLSTTKVSNIKPLKKLKNLKYLNIINCNNIPKKQIEDLQKALPELEIVMTDGEDE